MDLGADVQKDKVNLAKAEPVIRFEAVVHEAKQMVSDNDIRITFSLPEQYIDVMATMAHAKRDGIVLLVEVREAPQSRK